MMKITRVEIMALCNHDGITETRNLLELYDDYKRMGGNSYIDMIVANKKQEMGL